MHASNRNNHKLSTMEKTNTKKRKLKHSFLTTSKKCKRYRERKSNICNATPNISDSSSDTDTSSHGGILFSPSPQKGILKKPTFTKTKVHYKSKYVQAKPSIKHKKMHTCIFMTTRASQTQLKDRSKENKTTQCSMQNETKFNPMLKKLQENCVLDSFLSKVIENEQSEKFIRTVTVMALGNMSFQTLAWKSFLDMGMLYSLDTTTTMIYDPEWLEFCQVIYHMFGAGVINTFRGRGNFSQVTSQKTTKGNYNPQFGEFNFPVPSVPTLKKLHIGYPSEIPFGFVKQSLDIAEKKALQGCEFIWSFDGKLIAPGCKGDSKGDCDLWGTEGLPNLSQSLCVLKKTVKCAEKVHSDMKEKDLLLHFNHLRDLLNTSSCHIKRLRGRITGAFYLQKKLIEKVGDNQELQYKHRRRMSSLNQNTAECELVVRSLLEINMLCTQIMAILNSNGDVHIGEKIRNITLTEHSNNFQLLPPEVVKLFMDINKEENIQYVKQRSDEWFKIRKLARITGSTLHSGLGLETLTKQKEHHYIHVHGRIPPPIPENIQKLLDHGTKNEVNAIATLISTVVPAYLPVCYAFYELGPAFVHSEE